MKYKVLFFQNTYMHKGIAMIELIFAIVIIGIVMLSAPMLVSRATQSTYTGLQQESISAAATQISQMMTASWDQANINILEEGMPIIQTNSTTIANCTNPRPAGVTSPTGRHCNGLTSVASYFNATPMASLGKEGTAFDDIDDYDDSNITMRVYNSENIHTHEGDYIDQEIVIRSKISYGDDEPRLTTGAPSSGGYTRSTNFSNPFRTIMANSTNIKLISVTLTSENVSSELSEKEITLSAFMCNIGAPKQLIVNSGP